MQTATINIRLPLELKQQGDAVLRREGKTVSELIRSVYAYAAKEQHLPECLNLGESDESKQKLEQKRSLMRQMVGIIPSGGNADDDRWAYLEHKTRPGTRS